MTSFQRIHRIGLAMLAVGALVLSNAVPPGSARAAEHCDVVGQSWTATAAVDQALTTKFATYGNEKKGWSGGDSTYSVRLSDERMLWLFSDTFVGPVNPDGTQPLDTGFVNSSFVVQQKDRLQRTVTGGAGAAPTGLLAPHDNSWYWLGAGHLSSDAASLDVIFMRFASFPPFGQWDWAWAENVLGRFDPESLKLRDVVPLPSDGGVNWAAWLLPDVGYTLIYGVEDHGIVKYMHLARVAGDDLAQPWEFWTGSAWSTVEPTGEEAIVAARIMSGVANEYSVAPFGDGYLLVTQDTRELFSRNIVAYLSCSPEGPFTPVPVATLYQTPETGLFGSYGNPNIFTYNAHEHPQLRDGASLLVTYNVNSFDWTELYEDVTIYRPRFVRVTLTES